MSWNASCVHRAALHGPYLDGSAAGLTAGVARCQGCSQPIATGSIMSGHLSSSIPGQAWSSPSKTGIGCFWWISTVCRDSHCGEHLRDHGARHQPPSPPGHKELPPPARTVMLMGATTSSEFVAVATTKRRPSSTPVP
jgi:hypothetical protein